MPTSRYFAAAVQMCAGADKSENLEKAHAFVAQAAAASARLVVLPEVWSWRGERERERDAAEAIDGSTALRMSALAKQHKLYLVAGSILEENGTARPFNTSLLFDPAGICIGVYRKLHLFDVDIPGHVSMRESDQRSPGDAVVSVNTELGRIGMSICYDLRFPELYRQLTLQGADVIVVPAAFTFATGSAHWEVLLRARAIENQVYVIAPDQLGRSAGGVLDYGNSLIIDPWGKPLARAADREMVIVAEIDRTYQEQVRRQLPCLSHIRLAQSR